MSTTKNNQSITELIQYSPKFRKKLLNEALTLLENNEFESAKMILQNLIDAAGDNPRIKYQLEDIISGINLLFPCADPDEIIEWQSMKPVGKEIW
jgi:hypothetical protein